MRKILSFLLLLGTVYCQAQVTITAQVPSGNMVPRDALWNTVISNVNPDETEILLVLNIKNLQTGALVLSANSSKFSIGRGVKVTRLADLQPVNYGFTESGFEKSFLPMGNYQLCYQVFGRQEKMLAQDCQNIQVDPLSPPMLVLPENTAVLTDNHPQFSWLAPGTPAMLDNLSYDIAVAEVSPGQTSAEAIEYNAPVYQRVGIRQTFDNYPASALKLDTGKTYAWQVIARNNDSYAAKTDVWTFSIGKDTLPIAVAEASYVEVDSRMNPLSLAPEGYIKFKFTNRLTDTTAIFQIFDLQQKSAVPILEISRKITRGSNYIIINLNPLIKRMKDHKYQMVFTNSSKETYQLPFVVRYQNN